jgi:hypothetical protein
VSDFIRIYKSDITDRQFAAFWRRVQEAGRARAIGFDGPPMDAQDFCRWMREDGVHPWLVLYRGEPVGLYYLTNWQGRAAHVHFLTLPCGTRRTAHRVPLAVAAALFGLGSALWEREDSTLGTEADSAPGNGAPLFRLDALIGITPVVNREAVRFVRRLGGEPCGVVPALCWMHDGGVNVAGLMTVFSRSSVPSWAAKL